MPIYQAIKNRLRSRIDAQELPVGARVPTEQELVAELGVSRSQVRQALRDMEMEGYIDRFPGRGSFVAPAERRERHAVRDVRTVMIAYPVFSRERSSHASSLLCAFAECITEQGFRPVFCYIEQHVEAQVRFLDDLEKSELAGLALWPQFRTPEECRAVKRVQSLFPCVLVERYLRGREGDFVGTANRACYELLTNALMDRGHRTIAYVTRDFIGTTMEDRYAGYCDALVHAGGAAEERLVGVRSEASDPRLRYTAPDGTPEILRKMFAMKPYPTAIVCADDWTAARVASELDRQGLRVPDDIAMAVIDDTINPDRDPPRAWLTAVQDSSEIGRQTAQMLLARMAAPSKCWEQRFVRARCLFDLGGLARRNERQKERKKGGDEWSLLQEGKTAGTLTID